MNNKCHKILYISTFKNLCLLTWKNLNLNSPFYIRERQIFIPKKLIFGRLICLTHSRNYTKFFKLVLHTFSIQNCKHMNACIAKWRIVSKPFPNSNSQSFQESHIRLREIPLFPAYLCRRSKTGTYWFIFIPCEVWHWQSSVTVASAVVCRMWYWMNGRRISPSGFMCRRKASKIDFSCFAIRKVSLCVRLQCSKIESFCCWIYQTQRFDMKPAPRKPRQKKASYFPLQTSE